MNLNLLQLIFLFSYVSSNPAVDLNELCQASCPGVKKSESCTKTCMQTGGYGNPPPDPEAMKACGNDYYCWTKVSRQWLGYSEEQANYLNDFDKIVDACQDKLDAIQPKCTKDCEAQELPIYRKCISDLTQTSEQSWNDIYSCENNCMNNRGNFNDVRECTFNCNLNMYKSLKSPAVLADKQNQAAGSSSGDSSIHSKLLTSQSIVMGLIIGGICSLL